LTDEVSFLFPVYARQVYGALSFDEADHLRDRMFRRDRDHHVHVIRQQMPLLDPAFLLRSQLAEHALRSWRKVKVTDSRAAVDFAACMRELTDIYFPKADRIRVVMDNLSTHSAGALYQAFPACEARRVLQRLEFHYVPKHASWLNMVEIEIGVLRRQCLDRRIDNRERLVSEIAAWRRKRNASGARIKWMVTTEKARAKMGRAYPDPAAATRDAQLKES
jgi:hypothetical protein